MKTAKTMTKATSVKVKNEPKHEVLPQKKVATTAAPTNGEPEQAVAEKIDVKEQVKNITERAKQSDQFEYDDPEIAQQIFDKLPAGFTIKQGNRTVIQKL